MKTKAILSILLIAPFAFARADEYRSRINEGYDYYKNGEYDKAADQFKDAAILKPDKALPSFNKGTALYKANDLEGALGEFGNSLTRNDPRFKGDAYYNIGNSLVKTGKYDEAIKAYVGALKQNPKDADYKHNLEVALLQKQQQQQQQQKQDKDKDDKQNKDQKQQDQKKKDQQQQDQQDQNKQQDQQKQDQQQPQQRSVSNKDQMSKEQAQSLLARFDEDEKDIQKRLKQVNIRAHSINDW